MNTRLNEPASASEVPPRACLITRDRKLARAVNRTLVPRSIRVDHFEDIQGQVEDLARYGFILMDGDDNDWAILSDLREAAAGSTQVIFFSHVTEKSRLADLFREGHLTNLIAKNGGIREEELLITMNKLLTGDYFGVKQYLTHGTAVVERQLLEQPNRASALTELCTFLEESSVSRRFTELARTAADELLMNALGRAGASGDESKEPNPVAFNYACDGRYLAISVTDGYGSLTGERLFSFLRRCFIMDEYQIPKDTTGAGLGLYVAFRSADQFIVNIAKGSRTEVICLIDIRGHLKDFEKRSKSFHLFVAGD